MAAMVYNQQAYNHAYCRKPENRQRMQGYMRHYRQEHPDYTKRENARRNEQAHNEGRFLVHYRKGGKNAERKE